jgi:hypothetical protein
MNENPGILAEELSLIDKDVKDVMSVELCLKVNVKLQSLLEETLIKNLALKVSKIIM